MLLNDEPSVVKNSSRWVVRLTVYLCCLLAGFSSALALFFQLSAFDRSFGDQIGTVFAIRLAIVASFAGGLFLVAKFEKLSKSSWSCFGGWGIVLIFGALRPYLFMVIDRLGAVVYEIFVSQSILLLVCRFLIALVILAPLIIGILIGFLGIMACFLECQEAKYERLVTCMIEPGIVFLLGCFVAILLPGIGWGQWYPLFMLEWIGLGAAFLTILEWVMISWFQRKKSLKAVSETEEDGLPGPRATPKEEPFPDFNDYSREERLAVIWEPFAHDLKYARWGSWVIGFCFVGAWCLWAKGLKLMVPELGSSIYRIPILTVLILLSIAFGLIVGGIFSRLKLRSIILLGYSMGLGGLFLLFSAFMLKVIKAPLLEAPLLNAWFHSVLVVGGGVFILSIAVPVILQLALRQEHPIEDASKLGLYCLFGSILGYLIASWFLSMKTGIGFGLMIFGLISMVYWSITFLNRFQGDSGMLLVLRWHPISITSLMAFVVLGSAMFMEIFPFEALGSDTVIARTYTLGGNILVTEHDGLRELYVDDIHEASSRPTDQVQRRILAHLPVLLVKQPKSALALGYRDGMSINVLATYDRLKGLYCTEPVGALSDTALAMTEKGALGPDKVHGRMAVEYTEDPLVWVRSAPVKLDIIIFDCVAPGSRDGSLLTLEALLSIRQKLMPEGAFVISVPLGSFSKIQLQTLMHTFYRAFPRMAVFYANTMSIESILLVGLNTQQRLRIDYDQFAYRLTQESNADMLQYFLDNPAKWMSCFMGDGNSLRAYFSAAPLNTQDRPILTYTAPLTIRSIKNVTQRLNELLQYRVSVVDFLPEGQVVPSIIARIKEFEQAVPLIIKGHGALFQKDYMGAVNAYLQAEKLAPNDLSIRNNMLHFPALQSRIEYGKEKGGEEDWQALRLYGRLLMLQDEDDQAYDLLMRAKDVLDRRDPNRYLQDRQELNHWIDELRSRIEGITPISIGS